MISIINKKYLYRKEYFLKGNNELLLKNNQLINEYINEKIKLLINSTDKNSVINTIISDVKEIVEFDANNSIVLGMPVPDIIRKELVERHDIIYVLGNIFLEYHLDLIKNNKNNIPSVDYLRYVVDYNELYDEALTDYFKKILNIDFDDRFEFKKNRAMNTNLNDLNYLMESLYGERESTIQILTEYRYFTFPMLNPIPEELKPKKTEKSYFASFAFPALIDRTVVDYLREYYRDLGVKLLAERDLEFSKEEQKAMQQIRSNGQIISFNYDMLISIIDSMIKKYKIFGKDELEIFSPQITIGKILHISKNDNKPSVFAKYFKKEYYYLLERIFNYLNIRNNTMHLNNTNENYFSTEFSSILLQLFWQSTSEEVFKLSN